MLGTVGQGGSVKEKKIKVFFHFTLGHLFFKIDWHNQAYIFQGERSFFQFSVLPESVLKNTENKKNASIPGASFGFSMYLSTNSGKTEN